MPGITKEQLTVADCGTTPADLTNKLTDLLFSKEELASGNATPARTAGISILSEMKLNAIRSKSVGHVYNYKLLTILLYYLMNYGVFLPFTNAVHILMRFPIGGREGRFGFGTAKEVERWNCLKQKQINSKCRHARTK